MLRFVKHFYPCNNFMNTKIILPIINVLCLALLFLCLSISANQIAYELVEDNHFVKLFCMGNNVTMFLFPIILFMFLLLTAKYMIEIFDITNLNTDDLIYCIGISYILPIISMLFYIICFNCRDRCISTINDINDVHFLFDLRIKQFQWINRACWFATYYNMFAILYLKFKIPVLKAFGIIVFPSILVILILCLI